MSAAAAPRLADRYQLVRELGAGAMGSVHEAVDARSGTRVAVKLLERAARRPADDGERRARFAREASICAGVHHPHLVPVLDHGIDPHRDLPYLVMPLLEGEDLGAVLVRTGPLAPEVAVPLFSQACLGLAAAHAAGIVHRDIKPSNLFLEKANGALHVMISDFGLAKGPAELGGGLTTSHAFMGSAQYVSPEQATNAKHVEATTDVWSLGMSLYHALSGQPAFLNAGSFMAFLVGREEVPRLQERAPWVDFRLARAIHGALLRDPAVRCPSAVELGIALDMAVGIDVSRRTVMPTELAPLHDVRRQHVAQRAVLPRAWTDLLRG